MRGTRSGPLSFEEGFCTSLADARVGCFDTLAFGQLLSMKLRCKLLINLTASS
jgi:hypothetical protein